MTKTDYRQAKYLTKSTLNSILGACGKGTLNEEELKSTSKKELVEKVEEAQQSIIARCGKLFLGEY